MFVPLVAGALVAILAVWLAPKFLPRRAVIALGVTIAAIGAATVAYVEWQYALERTLLVQMPIALDRSDIVDSPGFVPGITGPYDIWLEFDRKQDGEDFACLTGEPGAEAVCPRKDPGLSLSWAVAENAVLAAHGRTDWSVWHARQAALDPAEAARRRKAYEARQARSLDPSNNWPHYYKLGSFDGTPLYTYQVTLLVLRPAGTLATLHPRLAIGLASRATKGLGTMALLFCLLCAVAGGAMVLRTIPRGRPA
jgi:hypothetical protein